MAEAHFTHIKTVIDTLTRHKEKIEKALDVSVENFGFTNYLAACSILKRTETIGTIVPNHSATENLNKKQLIKLIELVDQVMNLESEICVVDKALRLRVNGFGKTLL